MEEGDNRVSGELLALTYGAFVSQIVKDYEDVNEINKQVELLGYNIGLRLVEEYLAKTHTRGIKSFRSSCENLAAIAFPMYTGVSASIDNWNEDEQSCRIEFKSNPLALFVELPDEMANLQYNNVYCGIIRGAFEMIHMRVECSICDDMLKGGAVNEISIRFVEFLDDSTQFMLSSD